MQNLNIKSPGVYINEQNALLNPIDGVPTAVPAFIGYTPQASYEGRSYTNIPVKITSWADFKTFFCFPDPPPPVSPAKQYSPQYYLEKQNSKPDSGDFIALEGAFYSIVPDPNTIYYLYASVRLFYENGGGDAYIVSVGSYGLPSNNPMQPGDQIVNANVQLNDLKKGLDLLRNEEEPTLYICPEATLLPVADNGTLMQEMLLQCAEMQTAICIFDVIGGGNPDPVLYTNDIEIFRNNTGSNGLSYGAAYYPFIGTTILQSQDIDYTNFFGGKIMLLEPILNPPSNPNLTAATILTDITTENNLPVAVYNSALLNASKTYGLIIQQVLAAVNLLPPSGGIAGVIATIDRQQGPWLAPANRSIVGVVSLPIQLSETQQAPLNVDAVSGKSINAIRNFAGIGILIWGARTLDGNSQDYRYVPVRRTLIYLEQTVKLVAQAYVFASNTEDTWAAVRAAIERFLTNIWKEGGLLGASPSDAFTVSCGLGTTMTSEDILNGFMVVSVNVAVTRPAEFIVITFQQQMASTL